MAVQTCTLRSPSNHAIVCGVRGGEMSKAYAETRTPCAKSGKKVTSNGWSLFEYHHSMSKAYCLFDMQRCTRGMTTSVYILLSESCIFYVSTHWKDEYREENKRPKAVQARELPKRLRD